jgi:hypothetical protein
MNDKLKAKKEKLESRFNKLREDNDQYYSRWYKSTTSTDVEDCSEMQSKIDSETNGLLEA